ncbi:MAG: molybdopterin converting factor subunit 1 [Betaproteobacteria bacterium]|nr:molybdopterin converting factor subunit 1 [Betaproteobacteria bacterium]
MTIKLLYFASLREALGASGEEMALPADVADIAALRKHLAARGDAWRALTQSQSLRAALNQRMVGPQAAVVDGDEVAFFPPVTGG